MKKISSVIIFVFLMITMTSYGQDRDENYFDTKHELSFVIDDIFAQSIVMVSPYNDDYSTDLNTPKIGLGYKYHFANSAIRSKISFGSNVNTIDKNRYNLKIEESLTIMNASIGFELHKNHSKTQIFYGADFFINSSNNKYKRFYTYSNQENVNEDTNKSTGFGISPLLGVKYYFNPKISLSTELKFSIETYKEEILFTDSLSIVNEKTEVSGLNTNFGPLGQLSINIHF